MMGQKAAIDPERLRSEWGECRHCRKFRHLRPRGLCSVCYKRVQVRVRYPILGKESEAKPESEGIDGAEEYIHPITEAMRKASRSAYHAPVPEEPTEAPPGTEGKIMAMMGRAERGEQLFHPLDAGWGTEEEVEEMARYLRLFRSLGTPEPLVSKQRR